jgi:hypothetical protein
LIIPGRFSTITGCPLAWASLAEKKRTLVSPPLPGG